MQKHFFSNIEVNSLHCRISECQEAVLEVVVVEVGLEALPVDLPEEGGTTVITKIATTKIIVKTRTGPKRLSAGEDPDVMTRLQRTTEMLSGSNVNSK